MRRRYSSHCPRRRLLRRDEETNDEKKTEWGEKNYSMMGTYRHLNVCRRINDGLNATMVAASSEHSISSRPKKFSGYFTTTADRPILDQPVSSATRRRISRNYTPRANHTSIKRAFVIFPPSVQERCNSTLFPNLACNVH